MFKILFGILSFCNQFHRLYNMRSIIHTLSILLLLSISAPLANASTKATLNRAWVEAGVMKHDQQGLSVHVDFDLTEAKSRLIGVQAIFYSRPGGWALRDKNDKYRLSPSLNYVAAFDYFRPSENNTKVGDFELFIPVEELHLNAGHKYRIYAQLSLYADPGKKGEFLAESDFLPITIDLTDARNPKAIPDFSPVITIAEVAQAKKEGKQVGVVTKRNTKEEKKAKEKKAKLMKSKKWGSHGSNVEKDSIDRATFWVKEEVDSTALPKLYIE